MQEIKKHLLAVIHSYSEILFLRKTLIGISLAAITLVAPNIWISGLISVLAAFLFARFVNMGSEFLLSGFYTYNPLLVGLSIGALFRLTPLTLFFLVTLGIFTFLITNFLHSVFYTYLRVPILSIPFVIVSSLAYLASTRYSNLFVEGLYPNMLSSYQLELPFWLSGYLKSLGMILFLPNVLVGLCFGLVILSASRILFLLTLLGYFSGTLATGLMVGNFPDAFKNMQHFNFILIAMALGGVFLVPSLKSYAISLIAVMTATILVDAGQVFWGTYGVPIFALPFNTIAILFIYVLGILEYPLVAQAIKRTPEGTLDHFLTNKRRFQGSLRTLTLPFSGEWSVWQAFDGEWTHQGSWKYAYDFIILDEEGHSFDTHEDRVECYYAMRKPVLAPVRGRVLKVISSLPDNPIGQVDHANNWGNLVVIYDPRGFYVEISHFAQDSIRVVEGEWVERGALLGLCGNSGYSPQPHIHVQVQITEEVGAPTLPFSFVSYLSNGNYRANELPPLNSKVSPLFLAWTQDRKTSFILDDEFTYEVLLNEKKIDTMTVVVKMAVDGTFYFDSGKGKYYFGKNEGTYYSYSVDGNDPYLSLFLTALPRIPLAYRADLQWEDYLPSNSIFRTGMRDLILLFASFNHEISTVRSTHRYQNENMIEGTIRSDLWKLEKKTFVEFDETSGFKRIKVDNLELRRI